MLLACLHLSWAWTPGPVILLQCSDRVLQWCRSHDLRPTVMCIGPLVLVLRSQQRSVFPFLICGAGCPPAGFRAVRYPLGTCHPAAGPVCLPPPPPPASLLIPICSRCSASFQGRHPLAAPALRPRRSAVFCVRPVGSLPLFSFCVLNWCALLFAAVAPLM